MAPKACTHSRSSFWSGESIQPAIALFNCCPCLNEGKHAKINRLLFFRTIRLQLRHRHHHLPLGLLEGHHHSTLSYNCFLNLVGVSSPSRHRDLLPNVKKMWRVLWERCKRVRVEKGDGVLNLCTSHLTPIPRFGYSDQSGWAELYTHTQKKHFKEKSTANFAIYLLLFAD